MTFDKEINNDNVIRISVDYSRGDYGGKRGIFVRFDNLELIHRGDYVIERGYPYDGMNVFCEALKRANTKTLKRWCDTVNSIKEKLFELWQLGDRDAIVSELSVL
ncbi:hypothetical protein [Clavibacter sp.]|uniref:hypothetical protein n=1 Tax=Clavibacter sp. TaxID=1871044 RepID=UPI0019A977D1|nr:hypothetical protein [Clavibacter sp.]MBD5381908.1 hypothetical protein [Clavibacter sp.]